MAKRLVKGEKKLANYLDVDPTLMRALFVIAVLMAGTGVLAYIVLAVIMPDK